MKASYAVSRPALPLSAKTRLELLISFKGEFNESKRRALNLSLVIDRSGSMAGTPLQQAIKAAQGVVERMTEKDSLSVVIYDDTADTLLEPQLLSDPAAVRKTIGKIRAGGCTNLTGGWETGCKHIAKHKAEGRVNRVLLLTDGQANVGVTAPKEILEKVRKQAATGIATTTLGFGNNFNEDLLINMAKAGTGNFYFIESPDDAEEVFRIEVEGLSSVLAQDLKAELRLSPSVQATLLNQYRIESAGNGIDISLGDVYGVEEKLLAFELELSTPAAAGRLQLGKLSYRYKSEVDGKLTENRDELELFVDVKEGAADEPNETVAVKTSQLRIAKIKDEAITYADKGELAEASRRLRQIIEQIKQSPIVEKFEIAEELAQLEHYAERIEKRSFDGVLRKEMLDQAYQARNRNRSDLNLRGLAGGSTEQLEAVSDPGSGVVLRCEKESGRLRIRVISDGYDKSLHVQFPRAIREEGASYVADSITLSKDGSYYRASGKIRLLLLPGQTRSRGGSALARKKSGKASTVSCTAADLPTTTSVGDGILVQCVKEGSKLRARVVSDGYDPNFNMRFPRSIREVGVLYVVDEVILGPGGNSYIACGDIKRLIQ